MFLRHKLCRKDGKALRYWSRVGNRRVSGGRTVQRLVLYRGKINDNKLLAHKADLFSFLQQRWKTLFQAEFEVLLYDLASTYFEGDPPNTGMRRHGYSRDKRSDCVQVVITLIVTPDGLPLAYEVMPGNTSYKTTSRDFLQRIEPQYGNAGRTWMMDRGIPGRGRAGGDAAGGDAHA